MFGCSFATLSMSGLYPVLVPRSQAGRCQMVFLKSEKVVWEVVGRGIRAYRKYMQYHELLIEVSRDLAEFQNGFLRSTSHNREDVWGDSPANSLMIACPTGC